MPMLIRTEKGTEGVVLEMVGTKLLCEKTDKDHRKTGVKFAVEHTKVETIGYIDYPKR